MIITQFAWSATLELKRQVVDDIRKTLIAFANTEGGTLYVGIDDDGSAAGADDIDGEMLRLSNMMRDAVELDAVMFGFCSCEEEQRKQSIKLTVQRGMECPCYPGSKELRPESVPVRQRTSIMPGVSVTRNERLANVFYRLAVNRGIWSGRASNYASNTFLHFQIGTAIYCKIARMALS